MQRNPSVKMEVLPLLRFHSFSFPLFSHFLCFVFGTKLVVAVVAFSDDSVFGVSIENDTYSRVSIFISDGYEKTMSMHRARAKGTVILNPGYQGRGFLAGA